MTLQFSLESYMCRYAIANIPYCTLTCGEYVRKKPRLSTASAALEFVVQLI